MNAIAPALKTGRLVKFTVTSNGALVDTDHIVSIETWSEVNRIPRARIVLFDGEPDDGSFPFSNADTFVPGAKIEIAAGYGSESKVIHKGVVVRHGLRVEPDSNARLVVETADPLLKMTLSRHSGVTLASSDSSVIAALVSANGGTMGGNAAATTTTEAIVQAHASDWDLMLVRAEASGCVVTVEDKKVEIISPSASSQPVLELGFGDSIISFEGQIDAVTLLGSDAVKSRAWSYADQKVSESSPGSAEIGVPGNLQASDLAAVMSVPSYSQVTGAAQAEDVLTGWSTAALLRARLSQFVGTARFQGNEAVKPGTRVTLSNLGERFNGSAFVSGVRHVIRGGDWQTSVDFGLSAARFASRDPAIADAPAAGLSPPLRGLQTGVVKQIHEDPNGDFRVLVNLPLVDDANNIWARLGQPYASSGFGWSFLPEIEDEVVLGFMNEDPASAVIVASVYSNKRAPTHTPNQGNDIKALVTRSKMEVNFNDKDVILKISTPGGRYVELDDKTGTVTIQDPNGNKLVMTADKVDLISTANLNIKSSANMTIDCGAQLQIKAAAKMDASSPMIAVNADTKLDLASSAMASLKAGAILEVNGALVKIN